MNTHTFLAYPIAFLAGIGFYVVATAILTKLKQSLPPQNKDLSTKKTTKG
jgi:hypothetical protein